MANLPIATQWINESVPCYARQPMDAVAMVVHKTAGSKGSGWLVADRLLVTNEHVIKNGFPGDILIRFLDGTTPSVSKIAAIDASADLAAIELQTPVTATPLKIEKTPLGLGAQIYALGFPLAYNGPVPLLTVGYIAGFEARMINTGMIPQQRLVLNAALNPGNSGGPVIGWQESSVRGVAVSKHAPITPFLQSAIDALADNKSGIVFFATDSQGKQLQFVESQLVADVLKYFRSMTQVVIGEAIPASEVISFLAGNGLPWTPA